MIIKITQCPKLKVRREEERELLQQVMSNTMQINLGYTHHITEKGGYTCSSKT
jgi:hypothetical protein